MTRAIAIACILCACILRGRPLSAQQAEVSVHVSFGKVSGKSHDTPISTETPIVFWLTPLDRAEPPAHAAQALHMVQKNKQFLPHLLVVTVGSTIDFPNDDPFFHNVFSLFNGRRFDLGLYQAGGTRSARFDREGVSYIFCNIHPQMGGIVLSLATPYYNTSATETATIHNVPPGIYLLHVWSEHATQESMQAVAQRITIHQGENDLGNVVLHELPADHPGHKNMYGEDYGSQP